MYLSYEAYKDMGGELAQAAFSDYEFEAESIINWYTFDRLRGETEYPPEIERLMFHIIRLLQQKECALYGGNGEGGKGGASATVASRSNDGVSETYAVLSGSEVVTSVRRECREAVIRSLHNCTNSLGRQLLYHGVYPNE